MGGWGRGEWWQGRAVAELELGDFKGNEEGTVQLPIIRQLPNQTWVELDEIKPGEIALVRSLLNAIVAEGLSYPQQEPLSPEAFADYWLKGTAYVVRPLSPPSEASPSGPSPLHSTPSPSTDSPPKILGAFYIKPNFPGRCSHICNAGFIVPPEVRGQGIGQWMGEAMLVLAQHLGYRAVMFNLVFATNLPSLKIWASLGFEEIGRIPAAAHLPDGRYVEAIMLYKSLLP